MLEIFNVKMISSHLILSNHDFVFPLLHLRISIPGWPLTIISKSTYIILFCFVVFVSTFLPLVNV